MSEILGRATATAPANIAFIKYWGAVDLERALPTNPSISMTLSSSISRTSVEMIERDGGNGRDESGDEVFLADDEGALTAAPASFAGRVHGHLDALRRGLGLDTRFRVATRNSFPAAAGLASSASGFAALTVAVTEAAGASLGSAELSRLARESGSGSAARSVIGGYVEWPEGEGEEECHAFSLAPANHWDLRDIIAVVESGPKEVSSLDGHRRAPGSPHFAKRQELLPGRLERVRSAIEARDLATLGPIVEEEAIELHLIAMSSRPAIFYWKSATLTVLEAVRRMRGEDLGAWATMDAGANVHVLCEPRDEAAVADRLAGLAGVSKVLRDGVGTGPQLGGPDLLPARQ